MAEAVVTKAYRIKMLKARAGDLELPPITQMAFGKGGVDLDGTVKTPTTEQTALNDQLAFSAEKAWVENKPSILASNQQTMTVRGTVTDQAGMPVIGANIVVKGSSTGTITDFDGKFSLEVPSGSVLVVSYIGYLSQEVPVGNKTTINVTLKEDTQALDEVVVVGYGTMKKSDITGAISSVSEESIARQPVANVSTALQGLATGVSVTSSSGSPGEAATIRIRGVGTVNDAEPLYVVDGMPVTDINYLSTSDIQSIEVLKDASASAIYGSRGANGVILITTKKGEVGKTTVTLDAYWGMNKVLNNLDLMSGPEWYDYQEQLNALRSAPIDLSLVNRNTSTNWMDEITRTAFMHNYSVGISGGKADDYKYNLGLSYIDQEGTIKKSDYQRFSVRQSSEKTIIKDHLVVGTNASITRSIHASSSSRSAASSSRRWCSTRMTSGRSAMSPRGWMSFWQRIRSIRSGSAYWGEGARVRSDGWPRARIGKGRIMGGCFVLP